MIQVTEHAITKLKEFAAAEDLPLIVRLKVLGGGCAGFSYDMCFEPKVGETDEVVEQDGVTVVCDPMSFQYLDEVTIDFVDGLMGAGFKFLNPKAKGSCGCGSSFDM